MIEIVDAYRNKGQEWCSCCFKQTNTKRIKFSQDGRQGISVVLCDDCRKELIKVVSETCFEQKKEIEDRAYQKGLDDAWEVARKISVMPYVTQTKVFNECGNSDVFGVYTASEAKERIEAWEQKHAEPDSEEISVGDEVITSNGSKMIVTSIEEFYETVHMISVNGKTDYLSKDDVTKTGRHFDIQSILDQMREGE